MYVARAPFPLLLLFLAATSVLLHGLFAPPLAARESPPHLLLITIDTLRADRLSAYGYSRRTSPTLDALLASGARFVEARTVEPLTGPAMTSMLTALDPHEHASTRNGLPMRVGLPSLPKLLAQGPYRTAAFVGNWTLRDKLSGLGEHFGTYVEVLNRKRWFGLFKGEATGEDLTAAALAWLRQHREQDGRRPFLLWVHYVEPHAPYRLQEAFAPRLGVPVSEAASRSDRYDTEIAFVDDQIRRLLAGVDGLVPEGNRLVVFAADHGESLGEHGYWGHGRNLHEPSLRIPLGLSWPGHIPAGTVIRAPALITDITPTVLGLLGLTVPAAVHGFDWSPVLRGQADEPVGRVTMVQAHKGAVLSGEGKNARATGLLEVAILRSGRKEILRLGSGARRVFDLLADPGELRPLTSGLPPSPELEAWLEKVQQNLRAISELPDAEIDAESLDQLKALGYLE